MNNVLPRRKDHPACPYCFGFKTRINGKGVPTPTPKKYFECVECGRLFVQSKVIPVYDRLDFIAGELKALSTHTNRFTLDTIIKHALWVLTCSHDIWDLYVEELCDNGTRALFHDFYRDHILVPVPIPSSLDDLRAKCDAY